MKIGLTREQYENLIKLVYLGNWMINAVRTGKEDDPQIEKYNEIEQYIFSFAKEAGLEKYIEFDQKYNQFFPTREFEENQELTQYQEDYDDEVFWQELSGRLGSRDFLKEYGEGAIRKMDQKERFLKEQEFIIKYEEEFAEHGLDNLEILKRIDEVFKKQ
jgi:hypothetical protein